VRYSDTTIFLVAAEGRQPGRTLGMGHPEMAERLLAIGCTDALNLDGGGSSTKLVANACKAPRDERFQRPVGNAPLVVSRSEP